MDKTVMHAIFSILFLLLVTVTPGLVSAQADKDTTRKFCVDALKQSMYDATQCLLKPKGFDIGGKDPAVLTYLCCLGSFKDVTHNYIPYVSQDLIMMVANSGSSANLVRVGTFIAKCSRRKIKVTRNDFNYWNHMGRTQRVCKSPWQK